MQISIIIPTYNEEDVILDCLKSLEKQSSKDFEVLVVDDGSTDNTVENIKQLRVTGYELKLVEGKHEGAGGARNLGAKHAKGDILVFVDSDMTFDRNFLKMLVKPIEWYMKGLPAGRRGTFSKDEYVSNWNSVWARCYNKNEGWVDKRRHPKKYPDTQKVFRAILRSEFERVGGFTAGGYNDDWSLSEKLGYEATLAEKAIFYHKNPSNLKEIFNHAMWVGKRRYKFGILGYLVGLVRSSFPVSIVIGLLYAIRYALFPFILFKIVYDFGIFIGILNYIFTRQGSK